MSSLGSLQIAARALRVNKLRSALTVLGIVVGVAAVVCMVSVGAGAQAEVSEKIRTLGANLLIVMPGAQNSGGARLESGTQVTLTEDDAAAIRGEVVDVQVAAPLLSRPMPLVAGNKNWMALVAGINTDYLVAREWQMASGRLFTSAEMDSAAKVAIVGAVIVEALFEGRARIGETFRIGNVPFTVIGVLDKKGLGAAGRSQDDIVFIPLSTAKSRVLGAVRGTSREALDFISIKVSDADAMPTVTDEIEKLLRQRHRIRGDTPDDFRIENPADVLTARGPLSSLVDLPGLWGFHLASIQPIGQRSSIRSWHCASNRSSPLYCRFVRDRGRPNWSSIIQAGMSAFGTKRTLVGRYEMSACDPKETSAAQVCCGAII